MLGVWGGGGGMVLVLWSKYCDKDGHRDTSSTENRMGGGGGGEGVTDVCHDFCSVLPISGLRLLPVLFIIC